MILLRYSSSWSFWFSYLHICFERKLIIPKNNTIYALWIFMNIYNLPLIWLWSLYMVVYIINSAAALSWSFAPDKSFVSVLFQYIRCMSYNIIRIAFILLNAYIICGIRYYYETLGYRVKQMIYQNEGYDKRMLTFVTF